MMKPCILALSLLCLTTFDSFAGKESPASGLLFASKTESITQRTSLELFDRKSYRFRNNFSLCFEISIRDTKRFGYILRLIDEEGEKASLVFVNFRKGNNYYIDFNTNYTKHNLPMPVHPDIAGTGKWIPIQMDFDLNSDKVLIKINDTTYECRQIGFKNPCRLRMIFGCHGINLDVPAMALRNIRISEKGKIRQIIPLDESSGNIVHNLKGQEVGSVKNPTWLISEHFNWNLVADFETQLTSGIAYNPFSNEAYIIGNDSLLTFQTDSRSVISSPIEHIPMHIDEAIYNLKTNQTYLYNLNNPDTLRPSVTLLNMETLKIDRKGFPPVIKNRLHHHNAFFEPEYDTLFLFGGYGNFSYSNQLFSYESVSDRWREVPFSRGGAPYPRFFAASGEGRSDYEILIFGGFGNESGRQELGGRNLYDLFAIDLKTKEVQKLWEITADSLYVPATNLLLSRDKKSFYTLIYPHHIAASHLVLCRYDIETGYSEVVSNQIPILSEEIITKVFLFPNTAMNELVAVIREYKDKQTANIRIYTLNTPPVSACELSGKEPTARSISGYIAIGLAAVLCMGLLLAPKFRRKIRKTPDPDIPADRKVKEYISKPQNAVFVLGDFLSIDNRGNENTYRFSTKLQMLFSLVLLNSKKEDTGISTKMLSMTLWPEKEITETKNIRGVTINHLRKILEDMDGIELAYENSKWKFSFSESFYCDYIHSMNLCQEILRTENQISNPTPRDKESESKINELIKILNRGPLFPLMTEPWIESKRRDFELVIEQVFLKQIQRQQALGNHDRIMQLIETLFIIDPLNEDFLSMGVSTLKSMGRLDRASKLYHDFNARFKVSIGVEYTRSFESL